jgi:phosphomevalonate kinase
VSTFIVSAPGKLYLLGEYAVLEGAPALLTAVDRRVTVTLTTPVLRSESESGWSLTAPELGIRRLALGAGAGLPENLDADTRRRLILFDEVRATVDTLAPVTGAFDIVIGSEQFFQDGHKLGLGSSAAVAVALTAALAASRGVTLGPSALFTLAASAHSASQGGKGSGGDIAASVYGGLILYTPGSLPTRVTWPEGLQLFAVVTGTGSSTVDLVSRVADFAVHEPAAHRQDLDHLVSRARRTEKALATADTFLALAEEYFGGIEALDAHAHAGIVTKRHRELRKIAAASGAVFKTSGAGGGDLGLVFAKLEATDHLESVFTEAGATVISVPRSHDGVRMETT